MVRCSTKSRLGVERSCGKTGQAGRATFPPLAGEGAERSEADEHL